MWGVAEKQASSGSFIVTVGTSLGVRDHVYQRRLF